MAKRRITDAEAEHFLKQVKRKAKAKGLPEEQLKRWQDEYDKINEYLDKNIVPYLLYRISGKTNRVNMETLRMTSSVIRRNGVLSGIYEALDVGNAEQFEKCCEMLRPCYNDVVEVRMEEWRKAQKTLHDDVERGKKVIIWHS